MARDVIVHDVGASGDSGTQGFTDVNTNMAILATHHYDTSAPASPSNGYTWIDSTTATRLVMQVRQNGAWVNCILTHILEETLNCDSNQLSNMRLENLTTGNLTTPAAGVKGEVAFDTTVERFAGITTNDQVYFSECKVDGTTIRAFPLTLIDTPSTPMTSATVNEVPVWLNDAVAEELALICEKPIPAGYTGAHDLTVRVLCALVAGETANDTLDFDLDWISATPGSGDGLDKTETAATGASQSIAANVNAKEIHEFTFAIDFDDASNPVATGDFFRATLGRTAMGGAGEVGNVHIISAQLEIPVHNNDD